MHEMSVVAALGEQVLRHLPAHTRLVEVTVEVGAMEHLDDEVVLLAWEVLAAGSPLHGAALRIERIPLRVRCRACGHEHAPPDPACLFCPRCGRSRPEVLQGSGMVLRALEAEPVFPGRVEPS